MRGLLWFARNKRKVFAAFCTVIVLDFLLLWVGYSSVAAPLAIVVAAEKTAGFLLTLGSPEEVKWPNAWLVAGHVLGWFVSLAGWLFFPILISLLLTRAEFVDDESSIAKDKLKNSVHGGAFSSNVIDNATEELIAGMEKLKGKEDESD